GEQNLPSLFLDAAERPAATRPVRIETRARTVPVAHGIRSADLLRVLAQNHAEGRPTALDSYLQCAFQFYGRHTLKLEDAPCAPGDRLDFPNRPTIVHRVIAER